ncbi:glycosyltransferase family 4 protein [Aeromonas veronii]|uniref:glycosyltransferase family 4 protein n=1 Tax=Aeromonas veronii TaxID=654 RepID=UPI0028532058|nr:glycosyltransferase family 4 protein [Aeromonas veronii]MDR5012743.1 glycosyltransferase family 4 protein [Aeromonas veronii]
MKILFVTDTFNSGGREKVISDLANYCIQIGHVVTVLVLDGEQSNYADNLEKGVVCKQLNILKNGNFSLNPMAYAKLGSYLKEHKPDIIHYHLYAFRLLVCSLISKLYFIPAKQVRTVHTSGLFYEERSTFINKLRLGSEKLATKISDLSVIGISKQIHENNINFFQSHTSKLFLIYNGIDISCYYKSNRSAMDKKVVFVYLARLVDGKNHDFLLNIWSCFIKEHKNAELLIVGDGDLKEVLEHQAGNLKLHDSVKFLGHMSNVITILANANIALFPSSYEGFSISLLEYFASSLPVVAHDIPAFSEISTHGENIYLIPVFNSGEYLKAMSSLYFDASLRQSIGGKARLIAEQFSLERFSLEHLSLYNSLMIGEYK